MDLGFENADGKSSLLVRAKIHSEIEQSWWMYPIARFLAMLSMVLATSSYGVLTALRHSLS